MSGLDASDNGIGTASPWVRHPTDVVIPNTAASEYLGINGIYQDQTPVGRVTAGLPNAAAAADGVVVPGVDIVICLTCHRAHASNYADSLRFDYTTLAADDGCLYCHTNKAAF